MTQWIQERTARCANALVRWGCEVIISRILGSKDRSTKSRRPRRAALRRRVWAFQLLEQRSLLSTNSVVANPIVLENQLAGSPQSQWDISNGEGSTIEGYATQFSVNLGDTVHFKVNTDASSYQLDIYRFGYYRGNGARYITTVTPSVSLPQVQPAPLSKPSTGLVDAGNWAESASWTVPTDATSGLYEAKLVRTDDAFDENQIFFVVRNDASHSDMLYKTSDTTWEAYNNWGGNSLYAGSPAGRAFEVSYNRPFATSMHNSFTFFFSEEYPMVRYLEANGFDVSYSSSIDADRNGAELLRHKVVLSVGHDEYWSAAERDHFTAARDAGVNLAFFSGNEIFWKTRWDNSIDAAQEPYRTLVCYKESAAGAKIDPLPNVWTGTWRDPRFSPPADGGRPENALSGTTFEVNYDGTLGTAIQVPAADGKLRFWRNTSVATLAPGTTATLANFTLGYEWDEDVDNGFRPSGLIDMSSTTVAAKMLSQDNYGTAYGPGTATHSITLYRASSGALVFGAGTVQWDFGLDSDHPGGGAADLRMQQATVNLLADMGVQPAGLEPGLIPATESTDVTPPVSKIDSPLTGAPVFGGRQTTITGEARDLGGGVVAGVEVSVDGGKTWHPAQGRERWTYTWTPAALGAVTIMSRATDDSANLETPSTGITVNVAPLPPPPPPPTPTPSFSFWSNSATPASIDTPDSKAVELGVKFRADVAGYITGLRFYKSKANTGKHVADLWSADGALLATVRFTNETASGWQQVKFATPVLLKPNTTYVASYHTNTGHYSRTVSFFAGKGVDQGPLHALAAGVDGADGVFAYGLRAFPTRTYKATNYWVDVFFIPAGSDRSKLLTRK